MLCCPSLVCSWYEEDELAPIKGLEPHDPTRLISRALSMIDTPSQTHVRAVQEWCRNGIRARWRDRDAQRVLRRIEASRAPNKPPGCIAGPD